jgi:hypothetical protein
MASIVWVSTRSPSLVATCDVEATDGSLVLLVKDLPRHKIKTPSNVDLRIRLESDCSMIWLALVESCNQL